ncbi:nitrate ABC transporter permease [Acuticoccus sediminis]|uniref:Nitrate ABC transporter permease n=1 Tax=Acuticoccus sediminis TaxID=2184697 RepID=A0A8B2NHN3_9HYPH|nr:ABC transporter permease [Acuticoccus sediminis]RAH97433.1 nitrate ABC transporter permease [Acuticoccus sediminis]
MSAITATSDSKAKPRLAPLLATEAGRKVARRLLLLALFFAAWQWGAQEMPAFILPSPHRVWDVWLRLIQKPTFWDDLYTTSARVVVGFLIAAGVGTLLGLLMGVSRFFGDFLEPAVVVINTVSSTIWAIFALLWFGLSEATVVFVVFMTAMPLILTSVFEGTRQVNADYVELARSFRMTRGQILKKIYLPTILPQFFSGARLAFGFSARVVLIAETLGASSGIGYRLRQAADLVQTDQVFAWTLTLVVIILVIEYGVLKPLETRLFAWKKAVAD